jgi:hypothetical protein
MHRCLPSIQGVTVHRHCRSWQQEVLELWGAESLQHVTELGRGRGNGKVKQVFVEWLCLSH